MISQKQQSTKQLTIDEIKNTIRSANFNLADLRVIDVCIKERKNEIINNGIEPFEPSESLSVNNIRGTDYLYLHKKIKGKTVSRMLKEDDFSDFNFDSVKISPKARKLLQEKYKLEI